MEMVFDEMKMFAQKYEDCTPWYKRNSDLQRRRNMEMVFDEIKMFAQKYEDCFQSHVNIEATQFQNQCVITRRLKRTNAFSIPVSYTHLDVYKRQIYPLFTHFHSTIF